MLKYLKELFKKSYKSIVPVTLLGGGIAAAALFFIHRRSSPKNEQFSFSYKGKRRPLNREEVWSILNYLRYRYILLVYQIVKYEKRIEDLGTTAPTLRRFNSSIMGTMVEQDFGASITNTLLFALMLYECEQDDIKQALEKTFIKDTKIQEFNKKTKEILEQAYKGHDLDFTVLNKKYLKLDSIKVLSFLKKFFSEQDKEFLRQMKSLKEAGEKRLNYLNRKVLNVTRNLYGFEAIQSSLKEQMLDIADDPNLFINFFMRVAQLERSDEEFGRTFERICAKKNLVEELFLKSPELYDADFVADEYNSVRYREKPLE
jgi:hypothetical protein